MIDTLRSVLIIGYGSIGKRHRDVLKALFPAINITIVSRHTEDVDDRFYDIAEIDDLSLFDYFIIASQTADHYNHLVYMDERVSGKMILVEKPVFQNYCTYQSIANEIFVGYNLRFHPVLQKLKEILTNRKILFFNAAVGQYLPGWRPGTDYRESYSSKKEMGGGVLLDLSHEIDYLQWLCGSVKEVKGISRKMSSLEIDSDDYSTMIGITEKGILFNLSMDYLSRQARRDLYIQCNDCTIHCDLIKGNLTVTNNDGYDEVFSNLSPERNHTYIQMHLDIIEKKKLNACKLAEALSVMDTISKVRKSSEEDWRGTE